MSGGQGEQISRGIAFDPQGNVLVVGTFENYLSFGSHELTGPGGSQASAFVVKLDPSCQPLWSKSLGGSVHYHALDNVAVDGQSSVLVSSTVVGDVNLGMGVLPSSGGEDILLVKLGSDGGLLWNRRWGSTLDDRGSTVGVDGDGNVLLTGEFDGPLDLGAGPHASLGGPHDAKIDPNGNVRWARFFGSSFDEDPSSAVADAAGNVIFAGAFHGTIDFGGGSLTSAGSYDAVIAQYEP
jgi:hypothetical protein